MNIESLCILLNIEMKIIFSTKNQRWEVKFDCFIFHNESDYKEYKQFGLGMHGKTLIDCMDKTVKILSNKWVALSKMGDDRKYKIPENLTYRI